MPLFLGTKLVRAEAMSLGDYNTLRKWSIPENENPHPDTEGYLVEYVDGGKANVPGYSGYVSWSPKNVFEKSYGKVDHLTFGQAVDAMKAGMCCARAGWNGKNMFVFQVPGTEQAVMAPNSPYANAMEIAGVEGKVDILPHCAMWTINAGGRRAFLPGWLPSQSDMDATDWYIVYMGE